MKLINPEYTVEMIVQRMKEAAARSPTGLSEYDANPYLTTNAPADARPFTIDGVSFAFNPDLDIRPITLQPQFQTSSDDRYHVNDLLKYNDRQFVQNAYRAILKRPADDAGYSGLIEGLRSGELNKIDVLGRLRFSREGREKEVQVEGLLAPATMRKLYRLPVMGYLLNMVVAIARLPVMIRSHRQFEAHVVAQQETIIGQINHIGQSLIAHANQMGSVLADRTNSIERQLEHLANEQKVALGRIEDLTLDRIADLTHYLDERLNYLDERLNEEAEERQEQLAQATSELQQQLGVERDQLREFVDEVSSLNEQMSWFVNKNQQVSAELVLQGRRLARIIEKASNRSPASFVTAPRQADSREEVHPLDAFYASFDEQFRGEKAEIKERLKVYLPFVKGESGVSEAGPIIDVGCGRGEWLELLREHGLQATGVELNSVLVEQCRKSALDVEEGDLIKYLRRLPDGSIGTVTGFHIVEHLPIETLVEFLDETVRVLKTGGAIILETPNPRNVLVGTCNFYFDPTHRNPLPSEVLSFLVESRGFSPIEVLPLNPSDERPVEGDSELVSRFNRYFYGPMDYGIVGWKLPPSDR